MRYRFIFLYQITSCTVLLIRCLRRHDLARADHQIRNKPKYFTYECTDMRIKNGTPHWHNRGGWEFLYGDPHRTQLCHCGVHLFFIFWRESFLNIATSAAQYIQLFTLEIIKIRCNNKVSTQQKNQQHFA